MNKAQLDQLKENAKNYIDSEKKILQAQLDFLTNIQKSRSTGAIHNNIVDSYSTILKTNLESFLNS
jgi:hypothetical protein